MCARVFCCRTHMAHEHNTDAVRNSRLSHKQRSCSQPLPVQNCSCVGLLEPHALAGWMQTLQHNHSEELNHCEAVKAQTMMLY